MERSSRFRLGHKYASDSYNEAPSAYTAKKLYAEADCAFNRDDFDRGMVEALNELGLNRHNGTCDSACFQYGDLPFPDGLPLK